MPRIAHPPQKSAGPWLSAMLAAALVVACGSATTAALDQPAGNWRQLPLAPTTGVAIPAGYVDCSATAVPTGHLILVCRLAQSNSDEALEPLQILVNGGGEKASTDASIIKGPSFGDAYSVSMSIYQAADGTETILLIAEGVTEYPMGAEVMFVETDSLQRVGSIDLIGVDGEGDPTSILPLLRVSGPVTNLQIFIDGKAARYVADGTYEEPLEGKQFCYRLDFGKWVVGAVLPGEACGPIN